MVDDHRIVRLHDSDDPFVDRAIAAHLHLACVPVPGSESIVFWLRRNVHLALAETA